MAKKKKKKKNECILLLWSVTIGMIKSAIPCKGQPQTQKLKWKKLASVSYFS